MKKKIGAYPNWARIKGFVAFCKSYGCDEAYTFHPEQLWKPKGSKDLESLVRTLEALSSLVDAKGHYQSHLISESAAHKVEIQSDVYKGVFERLFVRVGSPRVKHIKKRHNALELKTVPLDPNKQARRMMKAKYPATPWINSAGFRYVPRIDRTMKIVKDMDKRRKKLLRKEERHHNVVDNDMPILQGPSVFIRNDESTRDSERVIQ